MLNASVKLTPKKFWSLVFIFSFLSTFLLHFLVHTEKAEAYGQGGIPNGELQDTIYDSFSKKYELVDMDVYWGNLESELSNQGYPDGKGNQAIHYKPKLLSPSAAGWWGAIIPSEGTYLGQYGEVNYGPSRKFYVGNKPFVVAFREKRSSSSANLLNNWNVRIWAYDRQADGTFKLNINAGGNATSDRQAGAFIHRFHHLDGSSSPNVSGGYDQWITNYITVTPDPRYPVEYVDLYFSRYFSNTETWEGWIDNFWIGPADQFNPSLNGNETELSTYGSYYNQTTSADPVDVATGNYTYQHTDLQIPGRSLPLDFTRYYNSRSRFDGPLGLGFSHTYHSYIKTNPDLSKVVVYPDGKQVRFNKTDTGYKPLAGTLEQLTENPDGTFTLTFKNQTQFLYGTDGKLNAITDKNENRVNLTYNASGQLSAVIDPAGRQLTFQYDAGGRISTVTDPLSRTLAFEYRFNPSSLESISLILLES